MEQPANSSITQGENGVRQPPVAIIGSGHAAYSLAKELRSISPEQQIVLFSQDAGESYSKPMLSTALAGGKSASMLVQKPAAEMAEQLSAEIHTHAVLDRIDTEKGIAHLNTTDGPIAFRYRALVLAIGAEPIRPGLIGDAADDLLSVNDLRDYERYRLALEGTSTVAILGAGLIGCEFANDLIAFGIKPILIDPASNLVASLLPLAASTGLKEALQSSGAIIYLGASALRIDRAAIGYALTLSDGQIVTADLVLSAVGVRPRVEVAKRSGIRVDRGIHTDKFLETSARRVYAIGDCAEVDGVHLPYIAPILHQTRALARTLSGADTPLAYPAMSVTVKTPCCPTTVCLPTHGAGGAWETSEVSEGTEALFRLNNGALGGFVLTGKATARRQKLLAELQASTA